MNASNNKVFLSGFIQENLVYSHEVYNEKFYQTTICVKRLSEIADYIPVQISERLLTDCSMSAASGLTQKTQIPPHCHATQDRTAAADSACLAFELRRREESENATCASPAQQYLDMAKISLPFSFDGVPLNKNDYVTLSGQFRSYNKMEGEKSRLMLTVFAQDIIRGMQDYVNSIELTGYICKPPIFRTTPFMREICDCLIAVNRAYNKSDYIPCIAWGRNARFLKNMQVGQQISIAGRIQSRQYSKKIDENSEENRIAYEVSIAKVSLCE